MKKENRVVIYAGTFDPITLGHLWVIEKGSQIFDRVVVSVGTNSEKSCYFSLEDRMEMMRTSTAHIKNAVVEHYTNKFLIKHAENIGASFILRGIRSTTDYEYEKTLSYVNRDLNSDISTVFLLPPRELIEVSSSIVKGLIGPEGWQDVVKNYVPPCVLDKLIAKQAKQAQSG